MPNYFNTCDVIPALTALQSEALTETEYATGYVPQQPKHVRQIASTVTLTTTFQRLDLATLTANTFPSVGSELLTDWDATNKLLTFNDSTTRNYMVALNAKTSASGIVAPPLAAPVYMQFRFVVPDGVSPGVDYYFPHATGDGYIDLQEITYNTPMRHQQVTPVTSDANKRATGVGCDVRLSAAPLTGTVTLPFFSIYMFGA